MWLLKRDKIIFFFSLNILCSKNLNLLEEETATLSACSLAEKVTAKCLVTAQAVQDKLDYHFMPLLEADAFPFKSLTESSERLKCISILRMVAI